MRQDFRMKFSIKKENTKPNNKNKEKKLKD